MALLEVNNLVKVFRKNKVLNNISFEVHKGEVVGLLGKKGSGKTTIMNCITGNTPINKGNILFDGKSLNSDSIDLSQMGILLKASFFEYMSTFENLRALLWTVGIKDKKEIINRIDYALELVGMNNQRHNKVKNLSLSMKQKLGIAQTFLTQTTFLIFDEPYAELEPEDMEFFDSLIIDKAKKENIGILISSNNIDDIINISDRIIIIDDGNIIQTI